MYAGSSWNRLEYVHSAVEDRRSLGLNLPDQLKVHELPELFVGPMV
jgi:hypothetical protein